MAKFFIDSEFLEGRQSKRFLGLKVGNTKPFIDLISIAAISDNGKEYYAISKDFNIKEAWNRFQINKDGAKEYWLRENVLHPIYWELCSLDDPMCCHGTYSIRNSFMGYSEFKRLIKKYGKTNKQIAKEVRAFIYNTSVVTKEVNIVSEEILKDVFPAEFYGYYSAYDHVVLCQLFGAMVNLPKVFPYYMKDLQQMIDDNKLDKKSLKKEVPQENCHNALEDARWNLAAYNWIKNKMNG